MPATPRRAGARPRRRRTLPPAVALAFLVVLLCGVAYLMARETSLFAVRTIDVHGADPGVAAEVRRALKSLEGESLVTLSTADAESAAERIPFVRSATLDRRFPHTLVVEVVAEEPIAVVRRGEDDAWLISRTGRVLGAVDRHTREELPRIWLPLDDDSLVVGGRLGDDQGAAAARALAAVPDTFPVPVFTARGSADEMVLVLAGKTELRLGEMHDLERKLAAAAAVLRTLEQENSPPLAYIDVTLPTRPVGAVKSQLEGIA
jgi:cell division protein FtsQ